MKFLSSLFIVGIVLVTIIFVYQKYGDGFTMSLNTSETLYSIYVDTAVLSVSLADSQEKWAKGLSGVQELASLEGKLFIFDDEQKHGVWMKEMHFPIDVLWFDNNLELVYIEKGIEPDTYPAVFVPNKPARFVLEVNSNLVDSLQIQYGDTLILPASILPDDIRQTLQE